jgi:hypothetical protein
MGWGTGRRRRRRPAAGGGRNFAVLPGAEAQQQQQQQLPRGASARRRTENSVFLINMRSAGGSQCRPNLPASLGQQVRAVSRVAGFCGSGLLAHEGGLPWPRYYCILKQIEAAPVSVCVCVPAPCVSICIGARLDTRYTEHICRRLQIPNAKSTHRAIKIKNSGLQMPNRHCIAKHAAVLGVETAHIHIYLIYRGRPCAMCHGITLP